MKKLLFVFFIIVSLSGFAQEDTSDVEAIRRTINLSEVVVRSDLNVSKFLQRIKNDTTYHKAFKNLHILGFTALNTIEMSDKKGRLRASLQSKTRQNRSGGCRTMDILDEKVTGDFYDRKRDYNYYTAQLYAAFFFTKDKVCGETNIVKGSDITLQNKQGLDKRKEQLKMLFFNPGRKIPGIPFVGDKLDIFEPDMAPYYDFSIDMQEMNSQQCYVFAIVKKDDLSASDKNKIVFDNITTWFNSKTMEIVARNYDLSYDAGVYDFDVHMQVQMIKFGDYLVPQTLRYSGNWDLVLKKRERGRFTATLFDFNR